MATPLDVTDAEFEREVLEAEIPVLVDFWAEWCAPCLVMAPILDELAEQYDGKLKFVKVNTEENFDRMSEYGIRGLPTLLVFKSGERVDQVTGARSKDELTRFVGKAAGLMA